MWQIGPDPFISTDMHEYYRSLSSADGETEGATTMSSTNSFARSPTEAAGFDPLWQLVRYMAWTLFGPSTAVTTLCVLLLDGVPWLNWKLVVLIASTILSAAPYVRVFALHSTPQTPPAPQEDHALKMAPWETSWR